MDSHLLKTIPLFAALNEAECEQLEAKLHSRTFAAYEPIFWIGEKGSELFIIQDGSVRLSYPDEGGVEVTVAVLGAGHFFGDLSMLDGGIRTATARAEVQTTLLTLGRQDFFEFLARSPNAAAHVVTVLASRHREAMDRLHKVKNENEEVAYRTTPLQRIIDRAAAIASSGPFVAANICFIIGWITFHSIFNPRPVTFWDDPPTFFWLGFMITVEAILLTIFVLNSQKRSADRDRIRADLEYQVNLKAQFEIMALHQKIDKLQEMMEEKK